MKTLSQLRRSHARRDHQLAAKQAMAFCFLKQDIIDAAHASVLWQRLGLLEQMGTLAQERGYRKF